MTPEFLSPLVVRVIDDAQSELVKPLVYRSAHLARVVTVPAGFRTDFASVPRAPFAYWLTGGAARLASVVHDYLLVQGFQRATADAVFLEAMRASAVPWWRRVLMWSGVRAYALTFGRFGKAGA